MMAWFVHILVSLVVLTGLMTGWRLVYRHRYPDRKLLTVFETAASCFPILLAVLLIRSFLFEPYLIPSGSLEPTLAIGDFIAVNKYRYGLKWPILNRTWIAIGKPKRGDIVVFRYPLDDKMYFVKRFVAGPGDHVVYRNKTLFINGQEAKQHRLETLTRSDSSGQTWQVEKRLENLNGVLHEIYLRSDQDPQDGEWVVPDGHYFAMGDNRDDSSDSRSWGTVPGVNTVGQAVLVLWSLNFDTWSPRWHRTARII